MISVVEICNLALSHLAQSSISALTQATEQARKCNQYYEFARDSVLRAHDWNFSTKVEALAEIADEEILGWDYVYQRPTNCLYIRKIYNESTIDSPIPTEYEEYKTSTNQRGIACDIEEAYCKYTRKVTDPNDFDPSFIEAISFKLAALMAKPLTGDLSLAKKMEDAYSLSISDAKRLNASERKIQPTQYNSYVDER